MKLNKSAKTELRKEVEKILKEVPIGQRIHLDKDLLEYLIFDTDIIKKNNMLVKFIVWSGSFLRKVDLSEVSFGDVVWDLDYRSHSFYNAPGIFKSEGANQRTNHYEGVDCIDLRDTNASIDFKESFDYKFKGSIWLNNCIFHNIDLSKSNGDSINYFWNCDFIGTNISLRLNDKNEKIIVPLIKSGHLNHCFVNGKKILTSEEKKVIAKSKLSEYEQFKKEKILSITKCVESQVKTI